MHIMLKLTGTQHLVRSSSDYDIELVSSDGSFITDANGKQYIDFMMGWCVGNFGWGNSRIMNAVKNYDGPAYVYPGFKYKPWDELASLLCEITPGNMSKCYRTTGGSESVDTALQIAAASTERKKFLSIEGCYHGNTIGPLSVGASEAHKGLPVLKGCYKLSRPLDDKALKKVETQLKKKETAAVILEPVICNLGVDIPSIEFMKSLRKLCSQYGTLLILDEVATGFGRTGKLFATEHFNINPDILCISKAISGGYGGLGATLTTNAVASKVKDKVSVYSTYGWHPLSVQAALVNIRNILKNKISLFNNITSVSQHFRTRLCQMDFKSGGELNIIGLAIAVDLQKEKYTEKVRKKCQENGLILTSQESRLVMFPALTIDLATVEAGLQLLEDSL
jgi:adenosylmethionine-8-amino-7-oxononanoate aminotransferase